MVTKRASWYKRFKFERCQRGVPKDRELKGGGEGTGLGSDIPAGSHYVRLFCPSSAKWPIGGAFEPAVFLIIELPSGVADSP
jgi:hypothetical protein